MIRVRSGQRLLWVLVSSGDQSAQWSVVVVGGGQ